MIFKPSELKRKLFFIFFDVLIIVLSVLISFNLRFDFQVPTSFLNSIYISITILSLVRVSFFYYFKIYNISWRHFGFRDASKVVYVTLFSTLLLVVISYMLRGSSLTIPRSIIPIEFFISLFLILTLRISKRLYLESYKLNADGKNTIIIADIDKANTILRSINTKESGYYPVAIIHDNHQNIQINGINVYSLEQFLTSGIECEVAIIDEHFDIASIYDRLNSASILEIKVASDYGDYGAKINDISVEDLLARRPQDLDKEKIASFVKNKTILISGAGGSIGSELCRQCAKFGAKELILLDNCEYNLYMISEEIKDIPTISVMRDIKNRVSLEEIFALYNPQIVIHAAAYKHVPLVEANIEEAIVNNVVGTKNIIDIAIDYHVEKFVMISTDKAVRPTNVMGTTKRICELYAQNKSMTFAKQNISVENSNTKSTDIVAVRFGNVLGSSGSVIPKFKAQIKHNQNITVTHPEITRYFMLIPEACELVLQAGAIGTGGEIFILDMGEPIKIVDLAQKMIDLSGKPNIKIEFSGLRPGEKLYEELLIDESSAKTDYESITVAQPTLYDIKKLNSDIKELLVCKDKLSKLKEIVPEFNHQPNEHVKA